MSSTGAVRRMAAIRRPGCFALAIFVLWLSAAMAEEKRPVPAAESLQSAMTVVGQLYETEWKAAKTSAQKRTLAEKLLQTAAQSKEDRAGYYALLQVARDIAAQAGEASVAMAAVDRIIAAYECDPLEMRAEVLLTTASNAAMQLQFAALAEAAGPVIDAAVAADRYTVAQQVATVAFSAARKSRNANLVRHYTARVAAIRRGTVRHAAMQQALLALRENPDDPEAHLVLGRYVCLVRSDWAMGLRHLAKGADRQLATVAAGDMAAETPEAMVLAADGWWTVAEAMDDGADKTAFLLRAGALYEKAFPSLGAGLIKVKAQKRIEAIAKLHPADPVDSVRTLPLGRPIDVLPYIDLEQHVVAGQWSRQGDAIVGNTGEMGKVMIPVRISGSYDLQVEFTRTGGNNAAGVIFQVGEASCGVYMGMAQNLGGQAGAAGLDGGSAEGNLTVVKGMKLTTGRRNRLDVQVRRRGTHVTVEAAWNGRQFVRWAGDQSLVAPPSHWSLPEKHCLGLTGRSIRVVFHSVKVRVVSGTATRPASK